MANGLKDEDAEAYRTLREGRELLAAVQGLCGKGPVARALNKLVGLADSKFERLEATLKSRLKEQS